MILANRYNYPQKFKDKSLKTLETALGTCVGYKAWQALDPGAGAPIDARYDAMPPLTKQIIRDNFPIGLVPNGKNVEQGLLDEEIEYTFTSGTTGDRVVNIWDQNWWDASEAASWKMNTHLAKLSYPQKEAKLASSLNVGISCEEDLPMEYRTVGRKLYLNEKINMVQWQPRHYARMAKELGIFKPVVLEANPSLLARLAYWAIDEGVQLYSPEVIVFTYEIPSLIHLAAIRKVFNAPLISSYGTTETGFVMQQCEHGLLHQNLDFCRIEFQPFKDIHGGPELGRIFVTTFDNPWNVVVKFDVGDVVRLHPNAECMCGNKQGMIVEAIEGRASNCTFTTQGRAVTTRALDEVLVQIEGVRDYHLEQNGPVQYELQVMLKDAHANVTAELTAALGELYGRDGQFEIKILSNILPGPAGKFRRTQANFEFDVEGLFI